ncbi:MAG: hypothetical protein DRQ42_06435 [Gammaproteobacteria bacterium]|nr:MAG: hypothetical protein DRQ42_06435 [Gammaproteobacteria bacterium]
MVELIRRKIDSTIEKRIITGMIVSEKYLQTVSPQIDLSYFQNSFTRKVAEWCLDFYYTYRTAPFNDIKAIFERESARMKEEEASIIQTMLEEISDNFEIDKGINVEFLVDRTLLFFKKRELEITAGNIQILLEKNAIDQAEDEVINFRKISKITSGWVDPFDEEQIETTMSAQEDPLLILPGPLGSFLGPMHKAWLVGLTGPYKRGKTWLAGEIYTLAGLSKIRVVFISLEMPAWEVNLRIYKRLTGMADRAGNFLIPCFDCLRNQFGTCNKPYRTNTYFLMNEGDDIPSPQSFDEFIELQYRPCTYCKDNYNPRSRIKEVRELIQEYSLATWFTWKRSEAINRFEIKDKVDVIKRMYGDYFRVKAYPRFSACVSDIIRDLDILEQTDNFVPELIVVDYADILKSDRNSLDGYHKEDDVWMNLARLAGERKALVIAPTQATGDALEVENVTQKHTARWKGKLGHVDVMLSLNQTDAEKLRGVMRIGMMAHRHQNFQQYKTCTVLQQIDIGQPNLGSYGSRGTGHSSTMELK